MTREALSERSAARTSYEVSGLRFGYVLTVCFERLSWVPCWGPAIPPPPIPPRILPGPSHGQPRMVRRGQYGPPERPAKGTRGPFRPKGPLNDRNACRRISFIPASSSIRILLRLVFSSISLSPSLRASFESAISLIYFRTERHEKSRKLSITVSSIISLKIFSYVSRKLFPLFTIRITLIITTSAIATIALVPIITQ